MIWSTIQTTGRLGITFLLFAVLALLLDPTDFGILGMAATWIAFINTFSELGFGAALIQREKVDSKHFSTIFFINVGIGTVLTLAGIILSWPCALFFRTPEVQPIMAVLSLSLTINSFSLTQVAIAQRKLKFRDLAIRDISASLIGGIMGVVFALLNFGVWSLVIQSLTTYAIGSILIWRMAQWRPSFAEYSFQCAKDLWPYSSKIFAFGILKYFAQNVDKLLIGYFLNPVALGLYTFAYKLVVYPVSTFAGAIGNYLFPKFSRIQDDSVLIKTSYLFFSKATNIVVTPIMIVVAFVSPLIVPAVFGQKWSQAVPLIQILTVLSITGLWITYVGQLMKALNRPGWLLNWSIFITFLVIAFMWSGSRLGIIGGTGGLVLAYIFSLPVNFWILSKLISLTPREILDVCVLPLIAGLFMILPLWIFLENGYVYPISIKIVIMLLFGASSYLAGLVLLDRSFLFSFFEKLKTMKHQQ